MRLAVTYAGAMPVAVKPKPCIYNLDPGRLKSVIADHTCAITPVHLYGQPADMDPVLVIAEKRGNKVIKYATHAQGVCYKSRRTCSLGHAPSHSFFPGKNLGEFGDAGAVTINDARLADKVRILRKYGSRTKYQKESKGTNYRLGKIQATLLRAKLRFFNQSNDRRRRIAALYLDNFGGVPHFAGLISRFVSIWAVTVWHLFVIRHPQRDALQAPLNKAGIGTMINHPVPPHLSGACA